MPIVITDHTDERIKRFLGLKGIKTDEFIIGEGFRIAEKMNKTIGVQEVLTSHSIYKNHSEYFQNFNAKVFLADDRFICEHVGYKFHQGLFALSKHPGFCCLEHVDGPILILNNLDNAENVGALIRSALGLGFKNILVDKPSCSPFLKRSIRVSMGNVFFANIFRSLDLVDSIVFLQSKGYEVFAAANEKGSLDYRNDIDSNIKKIAIIIGNEGNGIEERVKQSSTGIIRIPVEENVEHLNAAAAGAILMSYFSTY